MNKNDMYKRNIIKLSSNLNLLSTLKKISTVVLLIPAELNKLNSYFEIMSISLMDDDDIKNQIENCIKVNQKIINDIKELNRERNNNTLQGVQPWVDNVSNLRFSNQEVKKLFNILRAKSNNRYTVALKSIENVSHISGYQKIKSEILNIIIKDLENLVFFKEVLMFAFDIERTEEIKNLIIDVNSIINLFTENNDYNDLTMSNVCDMIETYERIEKWSARRG